MAANYIASEFGGWAYPASTNTVAPTSRPRAVLERRGRPGVSAHRPGHDAPPRNRFPPAQRASRRPHAPRRPSRLRRHHQRQHPMDRNVAGDGKDRGAGRSTWHGPARVRALPRSLERRPGRRLCHARPVPGSESIARLREGRPVSDTTRDSSVIDPPPRDLAARRHCSIRRGAIHALARCRRSHGQRSLRHRPIPGTLPRAKRHRHRARQRPQAAR